MSTASGATIQISDAAAALQGVNIRVARDATGAPAVPQGVVPVGAIYQFGPVGSFAAGSEISVPFDASAVPVGQVPQLYFAMPQADGTLAWAVLAGATREGDTLHATVPALGYAFAGFDPALAGQDAGRESRQSATGATVASPSLSLRIDPGSVMPPLLPGSSKVLSVKAPMTLTLSASYVLPQCTRQPVLTVSGLHLPKGSVWPRLVDLGIHKLDATAGTGAITVSHALGSGQNGAWTYSALIGCQTASGIYAKVDVGPAVVVDVTKAGLPGVDAQPGPVNAVEGEQVQFTVQATGSGLAYQWQRSIDGGQSFSNVSGATATSHAFAASLSLDGTLWRVVVSNTAGTATSNAAKLTVAAKAVLPVVTSDPASQTVLVGETASFMVAASGTPAPSTQWQTRAAGFAQAEEGWADIAGAVARTLVTPPLAAGDSGRQYRAVLRNAGGTATSRPATVTVCQRVVAPAITQQPVALSVKAGMAAAFSVAATGSSPLNYQWFKNGTAIAGANANAVLIPATTAEIGQTYQITVSISNGAGAVMSVAAAMTVAAPEGGEFVAALIVAANGGVLETRTGAAVVVPAGALAADARVTVLAEKADQVGMPAGFIPFSDVLTISTGGVAFTSEVTLNVPTPEVVEEGMVLALIELSDTAGIVGFGALNVQRLADTTATPVRSMAMASTPAVRVLCLDASHARFGTTVVRLDRVAHYVGGKVPESACTANAPSPTNRQIHSTSTAPCREHEFVPTSAGTRAALLSLHVYCQIGSADVDLSEWVLLNGQNTVKDYGRHRLEYRLGTDGPSKELALNVRLRFRLVRIQTGTVTESARLTIRPKVECSNSRVNSTACAHDTPAGVSVSAGGGWSQEIHLPVRLALSMETNQYDEYAFSQVKIAYSLPGQKIDEEPQRHDIGQPPMLRCDNEMAVNGGKGCIYADYPAVMLMKLTDPRWQDASQHIKYAQAAGSPGALRFDAEGNATAGFGQALRRNRFSSVNDANRDAACKLASALWFTRTPQQKSELCLKNLASCQCDEYPFASTWNGAAISPAQTSVREIFGPHNKAGGDLLKAFYQYERVLDLTPSDLAGTSLGGDDFWVHID